MCCSRPHGTLTVGRSKASFYRYDPWVGNWCWDAWELRLGGAVEVLKYLHKRGFEVEEGESTLFELWKTRPPTADELRG